MALQVLLMCQGQNQAWEQIQQMWALQRFDAEMKNPAVPPCSGLMPALMHMRSYIEMEEIFH